MQGISSWANRVKTNVVKVWIFGILFLRFCICSHCTNLIFMYAERDKEYININNRSSIDSQIIYAEKHTIPPLMYIHKGHSESLLFKASADVNASRYTVHFLLTVTGFWFNSLSAVWTIYRETMCRPPQPSICLCHTSLWIDKLDTQTSLFIPRLIEKWNDIFHSAGYMAAVFKIQCVLVFHWTAAGE